MEAIVVGGSMDTMKVRSAVGANKFLIVLDDVWKGKELMKRWEQLWVPLSHGAKGSWFIITTREEGVKNQMGRSPVKAEKLNPLADDKCLEIFKSYAFPPTVVASSSSSSSSSVGYCIPKRLGELGKEIVRKKIKGVPLTAKVVGSSLQNEEEKVWKHALDWIKDDDIMSSLIWSYRRLPTHLKQCFTYCSVFRKNVHLFKEEIIPMWMALGYLQSTQVHGGKLTSEEVGEKYLRDLVRTSLLEEDTDKNWYKMHDLIYDLAKDLSDHRVPVEDSQQITDQEMVNVRHVLYCEQLPKSHSNIKKLWSFHVANYSQIKTLRHQLKTVRALRIKDRSTGDLANFPELVHLRLLNIIEMDRIHSLPESLCDLYNLQKLVLPFHVKKLPEGIWKLVNLRYLMCNINASDIDRVEELTSLLYCLKYRTEYCHFSLSEGTGSRINKLKNMKQLRCGLNISGLRHVTEMQWAHDAQLDNKEHLPSLILDVEEGGEFIDEGGRQAVICPSTQGRSAEDEKEFFNSLKPHRDLERLDIRNYRGEELPMWVGGSYLSNIVELALSHCHSLEKFPPLGHLYNLGILKCSNLDKIRSIGTEGYGTNSRGEEKTLFPSLKELYLEDMDALEKWTESIQCFPLLELLHVQKCKSLRHLPLRNTSSVKYLRVEGPISIDVVELLRQMASSLTHVIISRVDHLDFELSQFDKLEMFKICDMFALKRLNLQALPLLGDLDISGCEHLEEIRLYNHLPSLRNFYMHRCNVNAEVSGIWRSAENKALELYILKNVRHLSTDTLGILRAVDPRNILIIGLKDMDFTAELSSDNLEWLRSWFQNLSSIKQVSINKVKGSSFPSFMELGNLYSLEWMSIKGCPELQTLPKLPSSLEKKNIHLYGCPLLQR